MNRMILVAGMMAMAAMADVRVGIRVGVGHPLPRPNRTVVVRPVRAGVVIAPAPARVVYAPMVVWPRTIVRLPPRDRIIWEDSESLQRREDWVDTMLHVNNRGRGLFFRVDGRAEIDFAEVHFANGQVQVVDFKEGALNPGTYRLLDFADGRHVDGVRLIARAQSRQARVTILMER